MRVSASADGGPLLESLVGTVPPLQSTYLVSIGDNLSHGLAQMALNPVPTLSFAGAVNAANEGFLEARLGLRYTIEVNGAPNMLIPVGYGGAESSSFSNLQNVGALSSVRAFLQINAVVEPEGAQRVTVHNVVPQLFQSTTTLTAFFLDTTPNQTQGFAGVFSGGTLLLDTPSSQIAILTVGPTQSGFFSGLLWVPTNDLGKGFLNVWMGIQATMYCRTCLIDIMIDPYFAITPEYLALNPGTTLTPDLGIGNTAPVPEPSTLVLWLTSLVAFLGLRRGAPKILRPRSSGMLNALTRPHQQ